MFGMIDCRGKGVEIYLASMASRVPAVRVYQQSMSGEVVWKS
jgi:hypothetical protein